MLRVSPCPAASLGSNFDVVLLTFQRSMCTPFLSAKDLVQCALPFFKTSKQRFDQAQIVECITGALFINQTDEAACKALKKLIVNCIFSLRKKITVSAAFPSSLCPFRINSTSYWWKKEKSKLTRANEIAKNKIDFFFKYFFETYKTDV